MGAGRTRCDCGNYHSPIPWRAKAEHTIAQYARAAYEAAGNRPGKKHRPYRIPEVAERLVAALGANDEAAAKAIFVHELPMLSPQAEAAYAGNRRGR